MCHGAGIQPSPPHSHAVDPWEQGESETGYSKRFGTPRLASRKPHQLPDLRRLGRALTRRQHLMTFGDVQAALPAMAPLFGIGSRPRPSRTISFELAGQCMSLSFLLQVPMKAYLSNEHALTGDGPFVVEHVEVARFDAGHVRVEQNAPGATIAPRVRIQLVQVRFRHATPPSISAREELPLRIHDEAIAAPLKQKVRLKANGPHAIAPH